jgi:1,4-alpha-glucan branching enzyme
VSRERESGELCLVLHAHMPYVEGFGTWPFGEEWLLEAIAASYLPLIALLEQFADAGAPLATVGVTPVLADQLSLPEVSERFLRFMRETRAECHRLDVAGLEQAGRHEAAEALRRSARDYEWAADQFERRGGDLLGALWRLRDAGAIELWTSSASHAVLPLLATEQGVQLQLAAGIASHRARFRTWSGGLWLPECAYRPGLDEQLQSAGVDAFCVDQTHHEDDFEQLAPRQTPAGPVAVPIDWRTVSLVWDERGYPADPLYRDYHAQTLNGLRPWANSGEPYDREAALARAREHARDFVGRVVSRADAYRTARGRSALVTCALDAELLGHWWYEGVEWLRCVFEEARAAGLRLATLPQALERHAADAAPLRESSWGAKKDLHTWDSAVVADFVWPARKAELRLVGALGHRAVVNGALGTAEQDAAMRAARELLALQSSDWAFMATRRLAADYPEQRVYNHARAFDDAIGVLAHGVKDFRSMSARPSHARQSNGSGAGTVEARLRGLAPALDLAPLLAPSSPWGRESSDRTEA